MYKTVTAMYFSATGTTRKVVSRIAEKISREIIPEASFSVVDFTLPEKREIPVSFSKGDVVVFGVPVYAGRVPNVLVNYIGTVRGNGAAVVPVVVYGNRDYDDSLVELYDILESDGFAVIAGGAFIGEHAFSVTLAAGRPDNRDLAAAAGFAQEISRKIRNRQTGPVPVKGRRPYRKHYVPKNPEGLPVDIRKVKPRTLLDRCTDCKVCVALCPMGSIDADDVSVVTGICIKCGACIKSCPWQAKYFDDADFLRHKEELEVGLSFRREPETFL